MSYIILYRIKISVIQSLILNVEVQQINLLLKLIAYLEITCKQFANEVKQTAISLGDYLFLCQN